MIKTLHGLSEILPADQIVARFQLKLLALLLPLSDNRRDYGVRLYSEAAGDLNLDELFSVPVPPRIKSASLPDSLLIVRCEGEFFANDKVRFTGFNAGGAHWSGAVEITHFENVNAIPAPRDLYLVVSLDVSDSAPQTLEIQLESHWLDYQGRMLAMKSPAIPHVHIQFED